MARSQAGKDGKLALAIAVSVEDGDTNAFLDGTAYVGGNVSVTATQKSDAIDVKKLYLMPSKAIGTSAQAGVGTNTKGDLLDDAKTTATGLCRADQERPFSLYSKDQGSDHREGGQVRAGAPGGFQVHL